GGLDCRLSVYRFLDHAGNALSKTSGGDSTRGGTFAGRGRAGHSFFILMLHSPESDLFETYGFNPYQFSLSDTEMLEFHRRQVSYFVGCSKVLDLGAGRGFFCER